MKFFIILLLIANSGLIAQEKYITKSGNVNFEASVPSFEEVAANNKTVTAIINIENGEIAALALVKAFMFKNALMEEHFNENYAESNTFPKATFKGKIENFNFSDIEEDPTFHLINGTFQFHGETKTYENIKVNISRSNDRLALTGNFTLKASDFNIKIPGVVRNKIAEEIKVNIDFKLSKK